MSVGDEGAAAAVPGKVGNGGEAVKVVEMLGSPAGGGKAGVENCLFPYNASQ